MTHPHFESFRDWESAAARVGRALRIPRDTAGRSLTTLELFVRDHRMREVGPEEQALEAHYGAFSFSQSRPGAEAARRAVVETSYGVGPRPVDVGGCEARAYERGPAPAPDDPDPRMPAIVVWCDGDEFFLVASEELDVDALLRIAGSVA